MVSRSNIPSVQAMHRAPGETSPGALPNSRCSDCIVGNDAQAVSQAASDLNSDLLLVALGAADSCRAVCIDILDFREIIDDSQILIVN